MTTTDRERVLELFSAALEIPAADQFAFLRKAAGDSAVVEEIMSLLELDRQADADRFLQSSAWQIEAEHLARDDGQSLLGGRIGPFKILDLIGSGGMGSIYLAERDDDQYHRRVVIKLIKRGMDTDFVLQRFRTERQILANLNHPNIGRLYSGGATEDGRPYFVMEYVDGLPLTEYAAKSQLSLEDRVRLFRQVCAPVQYAHQNLIVHRDLKPTNILVTSGGEPKLLDFGIAKLLNDSAAPTATATMLRAMTPEYASPEQITGDPITTATDVYSLGVVLYELLTGFRPYKWKRATPNEIAKTICEQEPVKPSARVPTSLRSLSQEKADKADTLTPINPKLLRGDLDNIVTKALRKDPQRRYSSVAEFSEDLERYLAGQPVRARRDTVWYRSSKFVGRHRVAVTAAVIVFITLIGGSVATAWEAHAARMERARAERRFQDVRKLADSFMFEFHDAIKDLPGALNARQLVVKRAVEYLDSLAKKEAGGDRALQSELAEAYDKVGSITFDVQQTIESHRKAMLLNEALVKADPQNAAYRKQLSDSYNYMSDAMKIAGHSAAAIDFARKSLSIFESLAIEHPHDDDIKALLADRQLVLGIALADAGDFQSALETDRTAMAIQQELVSTNSNSQELRADLSVIESHISSALAEQGDFAGALEYHSKSFVIVRSLFQADSTSARGRRSMWAAYLSLARLQLKTGEQRAALENCARALQFLAQLSSADPKDTGHRVGMAITYQIYGDALTAAGRASDAESNYRRAISIDEALVADDDQRAEARNNLARAYAGMARLLQRVKQTADAEEYFRKALALYERSLRDDPSNARLRRESAELAAIARPNPEIH